MAETRPPDVDASAMPWALGDLLAGGLRPGRDDRRRARQHRGLADSRVVTREGWSGAGLRPRLRGGRWRWWLVAWPTPPVLTVVGAAVSFAVLPGMLDPGVLCDRMAAAGRSVGEALPISVGTLLALQVVVAATRAPLGNAFVAVGEELGRRAHLQPRSRSWACAAAWCSRAWSGGLDAGRWASWDTSTATATPRTATLPLLVTACSPDLLAGPLHVGAIGVQPWVAVAVVLLRRWPRGRSVETSAAGR